jgi:hypothetical protein
LLKNNFYIFLPKSYLREAENLRVGKNIKLYNYDRTETRSKENDDDFDLLVRRNIRNSQINDGIQQLVDYAYYSRWLRYLGIIRSYYVVHGQITYG